MRVAAAQLPDIDDSDDKVFTTANAVIMLDGASAFAPVQVPAALYAHRLGSHTQQRLADAPEADLPDVVADAIEATTREFDLVPGESPSSTIAIARVRDKLVDFLVLGDTQIVTPGGTIRDDRMDRLELAPRRKYRERLAAGTGYDDEHRALLRELQTEQAQRRNRDGGYWIAEATPEAAHHAITAERSIVDAPWVVLATDGAYEPMEHLGLADWPRIARASSAELDALLRRCHDWEEHQDPNASGMPRAKRHDDKSLAAVTFTG